MKKANFKYVCLRCDVSQMIETTKETYQEVYVCQECHGALVDMWAVGKYKNNKPKENKKIILTDYIDGDLIDQLASELSERLRNLKY